MEKGTRSDRRVDRYFETNKSSNRRCSLKIGALKNFVNFAGKHLC